MDIDDEQIDRVRDRDRGRSGYSRDVVSSGSDPSPLESSHVSVLDTVSL